ncbi:YhgE/Pip domain-containing protein [Zhihengliuella halotolerans]|uniref:Putative membrane protein n=1 Tax=Zhihengliuella halotolerans TaxID=370736 RepID=A0A4Q8AGC6_9MICC|nr:YhgE/Pip domain-containing protein [Zhihengliuella halotolerans]RZU62901.1 putative membrane protein [Zhihengliuella halotolerans]
MTTFQLARSELKRMTNGRLAKIAIVALTLVPLLYGALYLYANWDPYSHLGNVKAAIVNLDEGATAGDEEMHVGDEVAESLIDDGTFGWETVDSRAAADAGVAAGDYAFALTIPEDFSASLTSPENFDAAQQAILELTTNDANNAMIGTIADKLAGEVHNSVAAEVGEETANQFLTGFGRIHSQLTTAAEGASELHDGTTTLAGGTDDLLDGAVKLNDGAGELATGARTLHGGTSDLVDGQRKLVDGATQLSSGASELSSGASELSSGLGTLKDKTSDLPSKTSQLADGAEQVADGNEQLNEKVQSAADAVEQIGQETEDRVDAAAQELVDSGVLTEEQREQLAAAIDERAQDSTAAQTIEQTRADLRAAQENIAKLAEGSRQVADGNRELANAMPELTQGIADAADGGSQLADGAAELSTGASALVDGQKSALAGSQELDTGAGDLADGAGTLAAGTGELADGATELTDGAGQVDDGASELASKLGEGAGEVPNPDDAEKKRVSTVIGDPVSITTDSQTSAPNYGHQLAPFFLTLAVWIGAFMLVQLMRPITRRALASNAANWKIAVGGWLPFLVISLLQATVLYAVVVFGLGLESAHPWMTWALLLGSAFAFTALIQGIVAFMGTPGKMVVLILLVLQLVSAGGTFPWETTPEPLHAAHQVLPMGFIVTGMRHLVYGADLSVMGPVVLALAAYTALGLLLSTLAVRRHKFWTLKTFQPELSA